MFRARAALVVLAVALASALVPSLTRASDRPPVTDETFYFVMADRFENGTTANDLGGLPADPQVSGFDPTSTGYYHGGDLQGIIKRLDYIKGLGTTSIWLTPSFKNKAVQPEDKSAGYHGYWITDFTQIDPHLGTNQDLTDLITAAHRKGMKVYFDIITNHTADVIGYEGAARKAYVSKDVAPYKDAAGKIFDDRDFAGLGGFPAMSADTSFPYKPVLEPGEENLKVPAWLNDVTLYHNRGDTTFTGEDSQYGDFFGLDDLFTENPKVVKGFIDVYETWIRDFGVDGFRIDTMKHVDDAFWQRFGPEVLKYARAHGKREFFMFGEVFDTTKAFTSHFTTHDKMQAVLDFPFQAAARDFASKSTPASALRDFFEGDDWYTDADSSVYQLPTFLGNHDMGRIGSFIEADNPGAGDAEWLARDELAHSLMYLSRGNPVIYYGDEQGFTGSGGDQLARQDMFANQATAYLDDDLIGTDSTHAVANFDASHPLYQDIAALSDLRRSTPALLDGAQQHRYSASGAGVYAFSRIDRRRQKEYVVAVNNSGTAQTAAIPTYGRKAGFKRVYGSGPWKLKSDKASKLTLTVPALGAVVYKMKGHIPRSKHAPGISLRYPLPAAASHGRMEVAADVGGSSFYEVAFQARVGNGRWRPIGTDDNAPYRVLHDTSDIAPGTPISYRATVIDNRGHRRTSGTRTTKAPLPLIRIDSPKEGARVRDEVRLSATTEPEHSTDVVTWERSIDGGAWTEVGRDESSPVYTLVDDVSSLGLADGAKLAYRAVLHPSHPPGDTVTSEPRTVTEVATPVTTAIVHYFRPAGDYTGWGLHLWGDAVTPEVIAAVAWDKPWPLAGVDADGWARYEIPLKDDTVPVNFILHQPAGDTVPTTREPGGDRSFIPLDTPEIWLVAGDATVYPTKPPTPGG